MLACLSTISATTRRYWCRLVTHELQITWIRAFYALKIIPFGHFIFCTANVKLYLGKGNDRTDLHLILQEVSIKISLMNNGRNKKKHGTA